MATPTSSDDTMRHGNTWGGTGSPGMAITFRCARCLQPRITLGRKLKRVQGIKQYVCKHCQEPA